MPVDPTVAIEVFEDVQTPPAVVFDSVLVEPTSTKEGPETVPA